MTRPHPPKRPPKKSELLEVRLSHAEKQGFLDACRKAGRTASDVVREAIARFIETQREQPEVQPGSRSLIAMIPAPIRKRRYLAVGAGLALFAALPSVAGPTLEPMFKRLDLNGDGVITAQEFWGEEVSAQTVSAARTTVQRDAGSLQPTVTRDGFAVLAPPSPMTQPGRLTPPGEWGVNMMLNLNIANSSEDDDPRAFEFVGMDADHDNKISFEEYRVRLRALLARGFELLDTDHDGFLTLAEFTFTGDDKVLSARLVGGDADCSYKDCARSWAASQAAISAGFTALDGDGDKRISLKEYLANT